MSDTSDPQKFSDLIIGGHKVKTTTDFISKFGFSKLKELVENFVTQEKTVYGFGRSVYVDDGFETTINGSKIYMINMRSPQGTVHILCDTFVHLVQMGVIKEKLLQDGQHKHEK